MSHETQQKPMRIGQKYFTYYISNNGFTQALETKFKNDMIDRKRILEGRVCKSLLIAKTKASS